MSDISGRGWALAVLLAASVVEVGAAGPKPLIADAMEKRDAQAVASLLKQGGDVNAPQPDGATALHWAAHWDDGEAAARLLAAGAKVDARNDYAVTPLWLAAENGSAAMIERLLAAGADPNAALSTGVTPLMIAARTGVAAAVTALVTRGADVHARQHATGQTSLMWAVAEQHIDATRVLVAHGADVRARTTIGFTSLMFAARDGNLELARFLFENGADLDASADDGSTALLVATVRGHTELAAFFLERGAKADGDAMRAGYTPMHWAAGKHSTYTTYNYPDAQGEVGTLLGIRDREAKLTLIKALLARGADVNARTSKPAPAFGTGNGAVGQDIGATSFYLAALAADVEVMRLLVANGADPLAPAADGTTPLMAAAGRQRRFDFISRVPESDHLEAVKLALELGIGLEEADRRGQRAMHVAAIAGFTTVIQCLADAGADLNPRTTRDTDGGILGPSAVGVTPLAYAEGGVAGIYTHRPEAAALLRTLGARSDGAYVDLEKFNESIKARAKDKEQRR